VSLDIKHLKDYVISCSEIQLTRDCCRVKYMLSKITQWLIKTILFASASQKLKQIDRTAAKL